MWKDKQSNIKFYILQKLIMKKNRFLALLWLIIIGWTLTGCWNNNWDFSIEDTSSQTDAVISYNDSLVDAASSCIASENIIWNTYDDQNSSIEDIKNAINNTVKECTTAKKNINSIWNWEWDSSLKDWILNIIEKYITYYTKFSEILPYIEQEEITEEENTKYEALLAEIENLDNELNNANNTLVVIQEQFAKNHWFELESNDENTLEDTSYEEETFENDEIQAPENETEEISENEVETEETTEDEIEE